ncbi:hypothetical protein [Methylocystis sp. S23]
MRVWITKYALSSGVFEMDADHDERWPDMVSNRSNRLQNFHGDGRDWHRTKESALVKAEEMRVAKIEALKKQIAKLENMRFE